MVEGKLLTVREVAVQLDVTIRTVQRLLERGVFPHAFRVGKQWRVPQLDVCEYVESQWRERQASASGSSGEGGQGH